MKGFKLNIESVNCVLLVFILVLVVVCCVKKPTEGFGRKSRRKLKKIRRKIRRKFRRPKQKKSKLSALMKCKKLAERRSGPDVIIMKKSNGKPAGCSEISGGDLIYVEECTDHEVCGTNDCNGCKLLYPA